MRIKDVENILRRDIPSRAKVDYLALLHSKGHKEFMIHEPEILVALQVKIPAEISRRVFNLCAYGLADKVGTSINGAGRPKYKYKLVKL